ncbi:type VI secretion system baseplate subunit TssE [Loktanella sp. M215]|uniref:type VI secretion system baseplate subunit TssE n=1 Tax=Loktanella sp. M215 TaxID=2675431 RepID=UPI001F02052B|nr:type VI secretion system baseplate subunit TssE [Loktanella sp. M215]MCF7699894.1 type VI secretion system baseplate subunit TssE [Loktanella sp. M215]
MADRTIIERLQPSLLDRLTDDDPDNATESRDARVITLNRLRDIVRRDLGWLLNANSLDTVLDDQETPHAVNSTLNYGIQDTSGDFATGNRAEAIRRAIAQAISRFEPRIIPGTLDVSMVAAPADRGRPVVDFDIHAELWAQPLPMELYLRSQIDLTTGALSLDKRT